MLEVLYKFVLSYCDVTMFADGVSYTEEKTWLSKECVCDHAGLTGVPQKQLSILVDQRIRQGAIPAGYVPVLMVCRKRGRYGGEERDHLVIRAMQLKDAKKMMAAKLAACWESDPKWEHGYRKVEVAWDGGWWDRRLKCLRSSLTPGHEGRIIHWHARFYPHLPQPEIDALAAAWTPPEGCDLNAANRAASRELYRLSRDLGWRKLTLRERKKLGYEGGQWVDDQTYARLQSGRERHWPHARPAPWIGEATLVAAAGPEVTRGSTSWCDDRADFED